jgi:glycerol kinase
MDLRAALLGLTFGCDKNHVVRAALESIPYQIKDVLDAMAEDSGITLQQLNVDGGLTTNHFVMQFLADLLETEVVNVGIPDVSALGAACLAGLQRGIFADLDRLEQLNEDQQTYGPGAGVASARRAYEGWKRVIQQLTALPSP